MTVLDKYLHLAGRVPIDQEALSEVVALFAEEAQVRPVGLQPVKGKQAIEQLFKKFHETYGTIQRVWKTKETEKGLEAVWALAGKRRNGEVFAMHGRHIAQLNAEGKIANLEVELLTEPS
ncbi:MAG: ethyl tert-butyl ether degradation protein EthD [Pseudanabaenaceae cyanobacterium]